MIAVRSIRYEKNQPNANGSWGNVSPEDLARRLQEYFSH
jgi:hypothetical protein